MTEFNPNLNFEQLAEMALEGSGGEGKDATAALVNWAMGEEQFVQDNLETLLRRRFTDACTHYAKDKRKRLTGRIEDILDFPMWGGVPLGNVSAKTIAECGGKWKRDAETRENKAKFCFEIVDAAMRHGIDLTKDGAARLIPKSEIEVIFARHFGDGTVQTDFDWEGR